MSKNNCIVRIIALYRSPRVIRGTPQRSRLLIVNRGLSERYRTERREDLVIVRIVRGQGDLSLRADHLQAIYFGGAVHPWTTLYLVLNKKTIVAKQILFST